MLFLRVFGLVAAFVDRIASFDLRRCYLMPFFLMGLFVSSAVLAPGSLFYRLMFAAQLAGYACPALAWMLDRVGIRSRLLALPQYFMLANLASLIACYQFLRGERYARWEPIR